MMQAGAATLSYFSSPHYQAHNRARLAHLASLGLLLQHRNVLELGSGTGDHTLFYLERGCRVTAVDARPECLEILAQRYPRVATCRLDLNDAAGLDHLGAFDVIHCYGILYHLERPAALLAAIGRLCADLAIVETCVSPDDISGGLALTPEPADDFTQSFTGTGCRPSRQWVFNELKRWFPHVYVTATQPDHPEFPLDWSAGRGGEGLIRTVFVASRKPLQSSWLLPSLPLTQTRFTGVDATAILRALAPPLKIIDVGALFTGSGAEPYARLLSDGRASVLGFEPIPEACAELNSRFGPERRFLPYAVADGSRRKFFRCNYAMTSSLYEPDAAIMKRYRNLHEYCRVESVMEIETRRLDDVPEALDADFLKIDVQGAELDVLRNASQVLKSVVAVQTEVEFVPIYRGQPLFADVDQLLRSLGFQFYRFVNPEGRTLRDAGGPEHETQLLWADAVYIRPPQDWPSLSDAGLAKLALILHVLHDGFDHAAELLRQLDTRHGGDRRARYLEALG